MGIELPARNDTLYPPATRPDVSFVMASYNAAPFLTDAVESALRQTGVIVEVLIVDDGSSDDSVAIADAIAWRDPRVRVFRTPRNLGPAGARNIGIAKARGAWLAVLDSDDLLHPMRSARLLAEAAASGADMIADDLLLFDHDRRGAPGLFLDAARAAAPGWIELGAYLDETRMFGRRPNLGFLKPMISLARLGESGIRYDESLRIAEDDALVIALLRSGARYRLLPQPYYFYRKHSSSISHRLSGPNIDRMRAAGERLRADLAGEASVAGPLLRRDRALTRAWAFTHAIEALKARRIATALGLGLRHPGIVPMLRMPLAGAARKLAARFARPEKPQGPAAAPALLVVSRQRLIGGTNGSSAYLIAIAEAARRAGFAPHLMQPSVGVFGRTPFYRLRPEMGVFESIVVSGSLRLGPWLIATDPGIALSGAWGVVASVLRRLGIRHGVARDRKRPPSISREWRREDFLAVADRGRRLPGLRVALADYAFQAEALPYLLDPDLRTAIVMHDLFHARPAQFTDGDDSVAHVTAAHEIEMLGSADAVLAIQAEEARFVDDNVPGARAILVPMPATGTAHPQPGEPARLLFVGSNTAPNVLGLQWFFAEVWPSLRAARPDLRLQVAGTVNRAFAAAPDGVEFSGLVDDLAACYARAGIVISPLRQGSGLKVKLIEALAHGKACVVTGTTLQGVEDLAVEAVCRADTPDEFCSAILRLAADEESRKALAENAWRTGATRFGAERSMAAFRDWLVGA